MGGSGVSNKNGCRRRSPGAAHHFSPAGRISCSNVHERKIHIGPDVGDRDRDRSRPFSLLIECDHLLLVGRRDASPRSVPSHESAFFFPTRQAVAKAGTIVQPARGGAAGDEVKWTEFRSATDSTTRALAKLGAGRAPQRPRILRAAGGRARSRRWPLDACPAVQRLAARRLLTAFFQSGMARPRRSRGPNAGPDVTWGSNDEAANFPTPRRTPSSACAWRWRCCVARWRACRPPLNPSTIAPLWPGSRRRSPRWRGGEGLLGGPKPVSPLGANPTFARVPTNRIAFRNRTRPPTGDRFSASQGDGRRLSKWVLWGGGRGYAPLRSPSGPLPSPRRAGSTYERADETVFSFDLR